MTKLIRRMGIFILLLLALLPVLTTRPVLASGSENTYTIKPSSKPYDNGFTKYSTYNEKTRPYYTLRSYLELLEEEGGGELVLSKGTYKITNTLYVPSNVTIRLNDGAKIVKTMDTGTKKMAASKSLFQLVSPTKSSKTYGASKYNGEEYIKFIGKGNASIDLKSVSGSIAIIAGHNKNIRIEGITFRNMNGGNFIKMAASNGVTIKGNTFTGSKMTSSNNNEAISIDVPDNTSKAFTYAWSKADKTVNTNVTISNNTFTKLERAIGSSKYTHGKYQSGITIKDNAFSDISSTAIRVLNWTGASITDNSFTNIKNKEGNLKVILVSGAKDITITQNDFIKSDRPIQIMPAKNSGNGSKYATTYNQISEENKAAMLDNQLVDMKEYLIRYNKKYNEFTKDTEKWEIFDPSLNSYTLTPEDTPFQNYFMNYSSYNDTTRQYYMLRSYFEQLERVGGGTINIKKGIYQITGTIYVPSNVTIILEDGATLQKIEYTNGEDITNSKSIFQLVGPSKSDVEGAYGAYDGERNIKFIGHGNASIDLNYVMDAIGIVLGHNNNVDIQGITFKNMQSGHFIELDASINILISNNRFLDSKPSTSGLKEGINIDTPDKNTKGFNAIWTKHDKTPNKDIVIENNTFTNLERAIGTHKYSDQSYHDNVQIINNTIDGTSSDAIRIINWSNTVIKGNRISNVHGANNRALLISGAINPTITDNYFVNVPRPIQLMPWKNTDAGSIYPITYNQVSPDNISQMLQNHLTNVGEPFIRVNNDYKVFDGNTIRYYYIYW